MKKIFKYLAFLINFSIIWAQNPDFEENPVFGLPYDPPATPFMLSGSWITLPNSPYTVSRSCCAYVEIGGVSYIYQFGGGNSTAELRRVARLNLSNNSWEIKSTMPYPISSGTAIVVNGYNDIYIFGGNSPNNLGKTLKYNVAADSWETKADMLTKITDALVVKYSESKIFVIGGGDGYFGSSSLKTNKVQLYSITSNSYSYSTDLPVPNAMLGGGLYRDTIITVGGYTTGGNAIATCYKGVINPSFNTITWTQLPNYPGGTVTRLASYIAVKGTGVGLMCTGGAIGGSTPTAQTQFWNFCTQSWQPGLPDNTLARSNYKACGKGYDEVYAVGGYLVSTSTNRVDKLTFSTIEGPCMNMVGIENNSIPASFELKQNFPNPFNPETNILFALPKQTAVKIIITNSIGEKISDLANGNFSAGNHTIRFNAVNLPSGVYFYSIITPDFKETKKMLLIK